MEDSSYSSWWHTMHIPPTGRIGLAYSSWRTHRVNQARVRSIEALLHELGPRLREDLGFDLSGSSGKDPSSRCSNTLAQAVKTVYEICPQDERRYVPRAVYEMTVKWEVRGKAFTNCNCSYGCPCQFNALPTHGYCCAAMGYQIDEGHFGDVRLDGLRAAAMFTWPGAVHQGNGTMQLVIDDRAKPDQRDALIKIMTGQETEEAKTMWWVYAAMSPNKLEPLSMPIDLEIDVDGRTARLRVASLLEANGRPIRNPVTNAELRARIDLPNGFEYRLAEIGSGSTKALGAISLTLEDTWGSFTNLHLSNSGVVN